ncbi:MAG: hypothetical protein Q8N05_00115 [Bacteroidota bacterium]|nr:hypothetical protein [Bacteroidota bacterium]
MNYELETLGRKVKELHPDLASELMRKPKLTDTGLIPEIIKSHYQGKIEGKCAGRINDGKDVFIGAILQLYDPDVLSGWKRNLRRGIRSQLANLFDVSPTAISNHIKTLQGNWLIYRKYQEKVERLSNEIAEIYCKN